VTRTPHRDLISTTTRGLFRDLMTDIPVGAITTAFQDEGFPPNPDCTYSDSSVRRTTTQKDLESVDWSNPGHINRVLRVFERLLDGSEDSRILQSFRRSLRRDGYLYDLETSEITGTGARLSGGALAGLRDPAAIQEQLERIQRAMHHDPALVVGTAKELKRCSLAPWSSTVRSRKFASSRWPCSVSTDSGWNCTPHIGRSRCRMPITTPSSAHALGRRFAGSGVWTDSEW
jgi:hypothetical protein